MKKQKLTLASVLMMAVYPTVTLAEPAPLLYKKADGTSSAVQMVVSPNADGSLPVASYIGADGKSHAPLVQAAICSISGDVPQLCDVAGEFPAFVYNKSGTVTSATPIQNSDPLAAGEIWNNSGLLAVSTGKQAALGFDSNGLITTGLNTSVASTTGALQVNGQINVQGIGYFVSSMAQVQGLISGASQKWTLTRRAQDSYTKLNSYNGSSWQAFSFNDDGTLDSGLGQFANLGSDAPFTGTVSASTLSASKSAFVPDTTTSDSSTAALNTESAAARFETVSAASQLASQFSNYAKSSDLSSAIQSLMPISGGTFTGVVKSPTPATTDNSTNVATTQYVNNLIQASQGSVTGDISASGSSLSMPLGSSGLTLTMSYSSSGTGSLSIVSTNGSISPVDIYETAAWGTTSFKGYTLDSGTITTTATTIDNTFYLSSNAWGTYHIQTGGSLYIVDIFGSGAGKRTVMSWRKVN